MTLSRDDGPWCAIDFGTSNSAVAIAAPRSAGAGASRLVVLEDGRVTMPSAVFHETEDAVRRYGQSAIDAYVAGHEGRLMRSLKSILGSPLIDETTALGDGIAVRYIDVIAGFLKQLKGAAEREVGTTISRVVLGRPVFFVDDDAAADRRAEDALRDAARSIGFTDIAFQFEPIAAALDYERRLDGERLVLVADIGGGTSDFSVVRLGGAGAADRRADRSRDVLASHGVHVAGTDFDQRVELDAVLPTLGFRARTPEGREVPHGIYFDLATWHLINGVYAPRRAAELKAMRYFYADPAHHRRLMHVVERRLGHRLVAHAEAAKIALSDGARIEIDLAEVEAGLAAAFDQARLSASLAAPFDRIVAAADETVRQAGVERDAIDVLYFTGGSTGLSPLSRRLGAAFPRAERVFGNRFSSVASGLGVEAAARFG